MRKNCRQKEVRTQEIISEEEKGISGSSSKVQKKTIKKKIAGIVVITLIGILGGLYALGSLVGNMDGANLSRGNSSAMSQSQPTQLAQQPQQPPARPNFRPPGVGT